MEKVTEIFWSSGDTNGAVGIASVAQRFHIIEKSSNAIRGETVRYTQSVKVKSKLSLVETKPGSSSLSFLIDLLSGFGVSTS